MKENEEILEKQKQGKVKTFFSKLTTDIIQEVKTPRFWVSGGIFILGITSTIIASKKLVEIKKENSVLKKEVERTGKQVNEAWYQAGKLQQQVISNNKN